MGIFLVDIDSKQTFQEIISLKKKNLKNSTIFAFIKDNLNINDEKTLDTAIENLMESVNDSTDDYYIKEIHNYSMILGKKYWGPGSYDRWIRLGMALKNSDKDNKNRLLLTWIKLSSRSDEFSFDGIGEII